MQIFTVPEHITEEYTVDQENFVVEKVMWDKSSARFNFVKAESIVLSLLLK